MPSVPIHLGLFVAAMALLAIAGFAKVWEPITTAGALRAAGLPSSLGIVRGLGIAEIATGTFGIVFGGSAVALIGVGFYSAFAVFVWYAIRNELPISSCGCLGASETPPSAIHIAVNVAIVGVLLVAVASPLDPFGQLVAAPLGESLLMLGFAAVTVYLLYALVTVLPRQSPRGSEAVVLLSPTRRAG